MSKKKFIIVYSSLVGDIDPPRDDVLTFTENRKFIKPVMGAKLYKVLPHLFLDCEYSVYIDANIKLICDPKILVDKLEKEIGVFPNPYHTNIYDEAEYCKFHSLDDPMVIEEQMIRYRKEGFNDEKLGACGVIVRKHTPEIARLNERWWAEICRGSSRDQISFPYVYRDAQYFERLDPLFKNNKYFIRTGHENKTTRIFRG